MGRRRAERIEGLLNGELLDTPSLRAELAYNFDAHHLGVLAAGPGAEEAIRELAGALDARLILLSRPGRTVWAWLGGRERLDPLAFESEASAIRTEDLSIAFGEPLEGLSGWRLTHRQASAALPVALRRRDRIVRYADVAVLAAICEDELLATSLRSLFLDPLDGSRDGGASAREMLRAYIEAGCNVSSAAARLGVNRHTAASRLRAVEAKLGRSLVSCLSQIDLALKLEELPDWTAEASGPIE